MGWFSRKKTEEEKAIDNRTDAEKYHDFLKGELGEEQANRLINELAWLGMTKEELRLMYGDPKEVQQKITKTKEQEILIHRSRNKTTNRWVNNSFVFEDSALVSFDVKDNLKKIWEYQGFNFNVEE